MMTNIGDDETRYVMKILILIINILKIIILMMTVIIIMLILTIIIIMIMMVNILMSIFSRNFLNKNIFVGWQKYKIIVGYLIYFQTKFSPTVLSIMKIYVWYREY